jgi:AraC family transcriptional regulator of adaptative response/methylated-DNA-[protein]-cysteine methyltransferase
MHADPHADSFADQPVVSALVSAMVETPLGPMRLVSSDDGIVLCEFGDRRALPEEMREIEEEFGSQPRDGRSEFTDQLEGELASYFKGELKEFRTRLAPFGTPFEHSVWNELLKIPYGQTRSYGEIARKVGDVGASRAVGRANGRNRIAIVVPCHRVIAADGTLHGYGGGLDRKRWLLEHEGAMGGGLTSEPLSSSTRPAQPNSARASKASRVSNSPRSPSPALGASRRSSSTSGTATQRRRTG